MNKIVLFSLLILNVNLWVLAEEQERLSPEVTIEKTPSDMQKKGGGEFRMIFKDFPVGVEVRMMCAHVIQKDPNEFQEVETFKISAEGDLWIKGVLISTYTFGADGIAKGERVRYRYLTAEGDVLAESSFIPYPLTVRSKKGTFSIEIELIQLEPMTYSLSYQGLKNGERMCLMSNSGGNLVEEDFFYRTGKTSLYAPGIPDQPGGYALLDVKRLAGDLIKVKVPWGTEVLGRVAGFLPEVPELKPPEKKPKPYRSRGGT